MMWTLIFWASVLLVTYPYVLYPALLWLLTRGKRAPEYPDPAEWPAISIVLAAHNEIAIIRAKIENTLALDYPADKLELIVVSDGSEDGTDEVVAEYAERGVGVRLHHMPRCGGKTLAQNAGVRLASGDVLVFTDANSMFAPDALRALVRPFTDPEVGCVCGELRYTNPEELAAGKGEGVYWHYEQFLKRKESLLRSALGANGSIYAVRRNLFEELGPEIISDFIMPVRIWRRGFPVVYEPRAVAIEQSTLNFKGEFRRRIRIISRSMHGLWQERAVLNPFAHGLLAFEMFSHKVLRWLGSLFLITALGSAVPLAGQPLYRALLLCQIAFYLLAALGNLFERRLGRMRLFYIPAHFCAINFGALLALWNFLSGHRYQMWQPVSRGSSISVAHREH